MIRIAWMYPDTLYLHGERGTILALKRFAKELGTECSVDRVDMGTPGFDPMEYGFLVYGPGEVPSLGAVIEEMRPYRKRLIEFIECGRPVLAAGTSLALFGSTLKTVSGKTIPGTGIIPVSCTEREMVRGDDEYAVTLYNGKEMELVGNQIQMIDVEFDVPAASGTAGDIRRFADVIYGRGNNGRDGIEGVIYRNSVFTNMLGPMLVGNPWLTVEMLRCAADATGQTLNANDPVYEMELKSLEAKKRFINEKAEDKNERD